MANCWPFLSFSILYSFLSVIRHNHFQSQGIDFSIYDQALWLYSKFERPFSTVTFLHDLADRFRPIMLPLSTLYWFSSNEKILLVFQSIILSAAVFPIWLLAKRWLPSTAAILIAFLYVDFVGIQATTVADFHEVALLPFFLAWLFYFLKKERWREYFIVLVICLSVRKHVGLMLAILGLYIFITKKNPQVALATFIISLVWSSTAIFMIMPKLGQQDYSSFVEPGDTIGRAILGYLGNPLFAIKNFFWPLEKAQTLFWSFFSFGLVPLGYLALLPVSLFQFASRFLDLQHPIRWTIYYQYSAELAVLLAISTIYGAKRILSKFDKMSLAFLVFFLLATHAVTNITLHSPLKNLLKPQFWRQEPWMNDTRLILSMVPPEASVAAQNNLLPHLSHRRQIYLIPNNRNADYMILDLHPGQNDWNFYAGNLEAAKVYFKQQVKESFYKPIASAGDAYLLKRQD